MGKKYEGPPAVPPWAPQPSQPVNPSQPSERGPIGRPPESAKTRPAVDG